MENIKIGSDDELLINDDISVEKRTETSYESDDEQYAEDQVEDQYADEATDTTATVSSSKKHVVVKFDTPVASVVRMHPQSIIEWCKIHNIHIERYIFDHFLEYLRVEASKQKTMMSRFVLDAITQFETTFDGGYEADPEAKFHLLKDEAILKFVNLLDLSDEDSINEYLTFVVLVMKAGKHIFKADSLADNQSKQSYMDAATDLKRSIYLFSVVSKLHSSEIKTMTNTRIVVSTHKSKKMRPKQVAQQTQDKPVQNAHKHRDQRDQVYQQDQDEYEDTRYHQQSYQHRQPQQPQQPNKKYREQMYQEEQVEYQKVRPQRPYDQRSHDQQQRSHDQQQRSHDQQQRPYDQQQRSHDQQQRPHDQQPRSAEQLQRPRDQQRQYDQQPRSNGQQYKPRNQQEARPQQRGPMSFHDQRHVAPAKFIKNKYVGDQPVFDDYDDAEPEPVRKVSRNNLKK